MSVGALHYERHFNPTSFRAHQSLQLGFLGEDSWTRSAIESSPSGPGVVSWDDFPSRARITRVERGPLIGIRYGLCYGCSGEMLPT